MKRSIVRWLAAILLAMSPALFFWPAEAANDVFRGRDDTSCDTVQRLDDNGHETLATSSYDCMTARYALPGASGTSRTTSYDVAFLEYGGPSGGRLDERQWQATSHLLESKRKKYVVVFIHGWHHNANVKDRDVSRMHVFLSYARSFLNQRPAYRDTDLVGIYVGWNAAVHREGYKSFFDVLSYSSKKKESERVAPAVFSDLQKIAGKLTQDTGNPAADKMLVIGHSFGGNMLATELDDRIGEQLDNHRNGEIMPPPLGDLTVIINPAGEARKFNDIQRKIRTQGLTFPTTQPPGYLSLTSTTDWAPEELCKDTSDKKKSEPNAQSDKKECLAAIDYDRATGQVFGAGQRFMNFKWSKEDTTTIGHFRPSKAQPYGATHDLTGIQGSRFSTNYRNGINPDASACVKAQPWLPTLRDNKSNWDTRYDGTLRAGMFDPREGYRTEYQLRAYLYRSKHATSYARIGHEPYWNIRTLPNLIQGHNDFVSYIVMCMINQFVLDDPGGLKAGRT